MKNIIIYVLLAIGLAISGCEMDNDKLEPVSSVQLSVEQLSFISDYTGEQMITITSTVEWTATSNENWCKLSTIQGEAGVTRVKVSVDPNGNVDSREAKITVTSQGMEAKNVKVVQLGEQEEIVLFERQIAVDGGEQIVQIALATNVEELNVTIPEGVKWVTISPNASTSSLSQSGSIERHVTFAIARNNTLSERTAAITFSGGKAEERTFTIVQKGQSLLSFNFANVNFDENIGMRSSGMQIKFDVETNMSYELTLEGDWLTEASKNEDSYVIDMLPNPGAARYGKIIMIQPDSDPILSDTLIVHQLGVGEEFIGSRLMDSLTLVSIYNATDMKNWIPVNGKIWAFDLEKSMSQWSTIKLNGEGRVKSWELVGTQKSDTNFRFAIPAEVRDLTQMTKININSWNLSRITPEFGALKNLDTLQLMGNIMGTVPEELGNLSSLVYLSISGNVQVNNQTKIPRLAELTGEIPASIYDLTALRVLRINYARMHGNIPADISKLKNLEGLYLEHNAFTGSLPKEMGLLTNMVQVILSDNQLSGSIPTEIGGMSKLQYLVLDRNGLSGSMPASLGKLSKLVYLHLYDNKLEGAIPSELGNLPDMEEMALHVNQLSGKIPATFGQLSKLKMLYLYANALTGSIPSELGNLKNLKQLIIYYNSLSGEIPASLDNITGLQAFVAPGNKLSGAVPPGILAKCNSDPQNFILCPQDGTSFTNLTCN